MPKSDFSEQLRTLIRKSGLSAYSLSMRTHVDERAVRLFLRGTVGLSIASIDRICDFFRVRIQADGPLSTKFEYPPLPEVPQRQ